MPHFLLVIGRGGEQISRLQQESGCKIQIAPGKFSVDVVDLCNSRKSIGLVYCGYVFIYFSCVVDSGGMPDRSVTLTGGPESIQ